MKKLTIEPRYRRVVPLDVQYSSVRRKLCAPPSEPKLASAYDGLRNVSDLPATIAIRYPVVVAFRLPSAFVGYRNDLVSCQLFESSVTASAITDDGTAPAAVVLADVAL